MQHNDVHAINTRKKSSCPYCGTQHGRKEKCPAHGSTSRNCGKKNHWQSVCCMSDNHDRPRQRYDAKQRSAPRQRSQSRRRRSPSRQRHGYQKEDRTRTVTQSPAVDEIFETLSFDSVNNESSDTRDEIPAIINITLEDRPHIPATLKAKVDTGASGNILPLRIFRRMYTTKLNAEGFPGQRTLVPSNAVLTAYNGTKIQLYGTILMTIPCSYRGKRCDAEFYVSSSTGTAILGLPSCRQLRLVEMTCEVKESLNRPNPEACIASNIDLIDAYPDRFEGIGSFRGEFHITIDKSAPSPRRSFTTSMSHTPEGRSQYRA